MKYYVERLEYNDIKDEVIIIEFQIYRKRLFGLIKKYVTEYISLDAPVYGFNRNITFKTEKEAVEFSCKLCNNKGKVINTQYKTISYTDCDSNKLK